MDAYDPVTRLWKTLPSMAVPRHGATAVSVNGQLYVIGGVDAMSLKVTTVEVYDPATSQWRKVTGMSTPRSALGAGAHNGRIYAVGGVGQTTLGTTEAYLP